MAIDVRQIGGIKANDSSDSALIAALDSRYGSSSESGGGATVLPTFNPSNTVIFGSPGVSITPASTGSSTYNVQLGLPASLEAIPTVTAGGGSGSVTVATTLEHGSVGSSDVSTLWGVYPRPDSSNNNKYLLDLTLPTNASLAGSGSNPATVGVTLNNGSVGATASDWGVKVRQGTTANSYYLDLHLPSNASVAGTGSVGSSDLTFTSADAVYTLSNASANQAKVSISGSGTSYTTKLILPTSASQSGGGGIESISVNSFDPYSNENKFEINPSTSFPNRLNVDLLLASGTTSVPSSVSPSEPQRIATGLDWTVLTSYLPAGSGGGDSLKDQIPAGFSAVKLRAAKVTSPNKDSDYVECYGMCLKAKATSGSPTNDAFIGFFLANNPGDSSTAPTCEFRFAYSFSGDSNIHGFKLFDLNPTDFQGSKTARNVGFTPWLDVGAMSVLDFANGLANHTMSSEGFLPLTVKIRDAKNPGYPSDTNAIQYYILMMKRIDVARNNYPAFGGFGINSDGDPLYLTLAKQNDTLATFRVGKLQIEYVSDLSVTT